MLPSNYCYMETGCITQTDHPILLLIFCMRGAHSTTSGILQTSLWRPLLAFLGSFAQCYPHQLGATKHLSPFQKARVSFIFPESCSREMWAQRAGLGNVAWSSKEKSTFVITEKVPGSMHTPFHTQAHFNLIKPESSDHDGLRTLRFHVSLSKLLNQG